MHTIGPNKQDCLFPNNNKKSVKPFALIHVDLWGAYSVSSLSGTHYFLTIVDDFSRRTWVFLLKNKSQAYDFLTMFCHCTQTQFGYPVQVVRSDNRSEFVLRTMRDFFASPGIDYQTSCVDTPQPNG